MKNILLVLLFAPLVVSCTKDNSTSNSNTQTFLEKYDGFGFVATLEYSTEYLYFYDSPVFYKLVEISDEYGSGCVDVTEGYNAEYDATLNIVTNENNNLLIELASPDGQVVSAEINVVGNTLTLSNVDGITSYTKTAVEYSSHNCN
jgi:hypothetical protein